MASETQPKLLEVPEQPEKRKAAAPPAVKAPAQRKKLKPIERDDAFWRPVVVDELVPPDHKVRAIWDLTGNVDLSKFAEHLQTKEGAAGRAAWDPRLLVSVWLYAYSEEVTSAREIEALMEYEPGLMWLSGVAQINHHTLSDFRAAHQEALKELMVQLLGVLSQEGFVKLECVAHDGTKVRAQAGADTFRRRGTLEKEMAKAREKVEELDGAEAAGEDGTRRREAARKRAARMRSERLAEAAKELDQVCGGKGSQEEKLEARVSLTEPEARIMHHGDHAIGPAYNVQISTDAAHKVVVGVHLTQNSSDHGSLPPAMEEVKETAGRYPEAAVVDGGFTDAATIEAMEEKEIDLYGSLPRPEAKEKASMLAAGIDPAFGPSAFVVLEQQQSVRCPAGEVLEYVGQSKKREVTYHQYRAAAGVCAECVEQRRCCPKSAEKGRMVSIRIAESESVAAFRAKMETEAAREIYRKRGAVAEFPNCWIKEKLGLRKFRLRGMAKASMEALWAVITYNVQQWIRLSWRPKLEARLAGNA